MNFSKFVVFVGKEWGFITWLNAAYYTTKVSVINTQSSIYINLLEQFEFWFQNMINNDQSTLLLNCCEDVKSHRSGGDTVPLKFMKINRNLCITYTLLYAHDFFCQRRFQFRNIFNTCLIKMQGIHMYHLNDYTMLYYVRTILKYKLFIICPTSLPDCIGIIVRHFKSLFNDSMFIIFTR